MFIHSVQTRKPIPCLFIIFKIIFQEEDVSQTFTTSEQTVDTIFNASLIEEDHFNVTEHRGFIHGFVEALSVILVSVHFDEAVYTKK